MQKHIGTKLINAVPMSRIAYNELRGWTLPEDENGDDEGYLVEYLDGGKPNLYGFAGYVSWSPKEQFDNAYRPIDSMTFGLAIEAIKKGERVARAGWNGKGMWIVYVPGRENVFEYASGRKDIISGLPWIGMKTADNKFVPWLASQTDVLAEDWQIVTI